MIDNVTALSKTYFPEFRSRRMSVDILRIKRFLSQMKLANIGVFEDQGFSTVEFHTTPVC